MKSYKVKITGIPGRSNYSGQSGYGLDVGARKTEGSQSKNPFDYTTDYLPEVDREDANIEAEKGETAIGDFAGDGVLRHKKIGGDRHTQGGTPLNVPEKTFLFSDTKSLKIKDKNLLDYFNMPYKKGGFTPAKIASTRYGNLDKFTAALEDPNVDMLSKKTMAMNRNNALQKLGMLSLVQEGMKGFPQGIPDIARPYMSDEQIAAIEGESTQEVEDQENMEQPEMQYGGDYYTPFYASGGYLPEYQTAGGYPGGPTQKVKKEQIPEFEKQGYGRLPGTNIWQRIQQRDKEKGAKGQPGSSTPGSWQKGRTVSGSGISPIKFTLEDLKQNPNLYKTFLEKEGWKNATPEEQKAALERLKRGQRSIYTPGKATAGTPDQPDYCDESKGFKWNPSTGKCELIERITYEEDPTKPKIPDTPPGGTPPGGSGGGWMYNDMFNVGAAAMIPPKTYWAYEAQPMAKIPEPTFYDPERELAKQSSDARMLAEYSAQNDPQAFGARAKALQANLAEGAADTMGRYQNLNVGVANQFSPLQAQIMNQLMEQRVGRVNRLWAGNTIAKQQSDNAWREYIDRVNTARNWAEQNKMKRNLINSINPYYQLDRSGSVRMRPGVDVTSMITAGGPTATTGQDYDAMIAEAQELKAKQLPDATINAILRSKYPRVFGTSGGSNAQLSQMQELAGMYGQMGGSFSAYPFTQ
jgi:hypothetical protein